MIKSIHIQALGLWLLYSVITKGSFLEGMTKTIEGKDAYFLNIFFSMLFGIVFLFLFSHEDFFKFTREIENKNKKKERLWASRFRHFGKALTSLLIGIASGPLIGALAVRFLLPKYKFKYLIIGISSALSATIWLGIARGVIPFRLPF